MTYADVEVQTEVQKVSAMDFVYDVGVRVCSEHSGALEAGEVINECCELVEDAIDQWAEAFNVDPSDAGVRMEEDMMIFVSMSRERVL